MHSLDVLKRPIISEKAELLRDKNIYIFKVDKNANKKMIKDAIHKIYGLVPRKINVVNRRAKRKRNRFGYGYTSSLKKAYVYLNKKEKIEIFRSL